MLTNTDMTFDEMIDRFGEISAWQYLAEIEKAAGVMPRYEIADPEVRLVYAHRLQNSKSEANKMQKIIQAQAA